MRRLPHVAPKLFTLGVALFLTAAVKPAMAQEPNFRQPQSIVLEADEKPAFPAAPVGFDQKRTGIAHGTIDTVTYDSKSVGTKRKMSVYTPPGYNKNSNTKYPVLYLLHGIGGDHKEWTTEDAAHEVLDNLYADKKLVPMIVVMPNGRAQKDDRSSGGMGAMGAFGAFDKDLLGSIIPYMEANYPVKANRENRALAGLSMGGGQSLNFGLANTNTFAYVGGFSSAPNTMAPDKLVADVEGAKKLKLLWVSVGDKDGLITVSRGVHKYLKEKDIKHIWHIDSGGHKPNVWNNDLYLFSQLLFK